MDLRYLHRLSRQVRPRPQDAPAAEIDEAAVATSDRSDGAAGTTNAWSTDGPYAGTSITDRLVPPHRHASGACDVCGRTLLTGEVSSLLEVDGTVLSACPLCVIRIQRDARRQAA